MLETFVQSVENTFVQFSLRRLIYLVFILSLVVGTAIFVDRSTSYSFSRRFDAQLTALERLRKLEADGVRQSAALASLYDSLVAELKNHRVDTSSTFNIAISELVAKFVAAALIPLLFVAVGVVQMLRRQPEAGATFLGAILASIVLGVPALLIPTFHSLRTTVIVFAVADVVLMIAFGMYFNAKARDAAG